MLRFPLFIALFAACLSMSALVVDAEAQTSTPSVPVLIATPDQPGAIPLRAARTRDHEQWMLMPEGFRIARNVNAPTLTPFLPDPAAASGAAVIIAPGGAFRGLSMDMEGYEVARWLSGHGVAAFVLKYRTIETPREMQAYFGAMAAFMTGLASPNAASQITTPAEALDDGQTAIRMVRARSAEWRVDPHRVGFVGFSAGAILTMSVGTNAEAAARPDFIAPIYGPLGRQTAPSDAPPMFLAVALDDPLMSRSSDKFGLVQSWLEAGRPVEAHFYERGGHGFGMSGKTPASALWINEFYAWMIDRGLVPKLPSSAHTP